MNTRKKIDKLYFSKFEGAEVAPPEEAWQNIASRLPNGKQKGRILPLWFRLAGAAAVLLLLVNIGFNFFSTGSSGAIGNTSVTRQDIYKEITLSSSEFTETMLQVSMTLQEIMQNREATTGISSEERSTGKAGNSTLALGKTPDRPTWKTNKEEQTGMAEFVNPESIVPEQQAGNESILADNSTGNVLAEEDPSPAAGGQVDPQSGGGTEFIEGGNSKENAIAQQVANEISEAKVKAGEGARVSISTRVAPVFYENMGRGNTMGASMAGSEASGEVSVSYGVNLAYQISDRVKIRSGINKLDLSFNTPGVPMATAMNSPTVLGEKDPALMSRLVEGDLRQQMDFIEVPMEVEYRLLDSRIGLNLIAGGSTLFLNGNNVSMDTGNHTTDLGEAENMEKLNFSANMGLGIDYKLAPKIRLTLEPMFKYQLNSVNDDTGVRPYYMAIYSGFSFSF